MKEKKGLQRKSMVTTKKGDKGKTGLLDGTRVSKASARPEAYGIMDEAASFLGLARSKVGDHLLEECLLTIQDHIFIVNSELASPPGLEANLKRRIGRKHLLFLERVEKKIESRLKLPRKFVIYGSTEESAILDVARAVIRRAERAVVRLADQDPLPNAYLIKYINRLSDVLYLLARKIEADRGITPYHPGEMDPD